MRKKERKDTPLHVAIYENDVVSFRQLLASGADIEARGEADYTALHQALTYGRADMALTLMDAGANLHALDMHGDTMLHHAFATKSPEIMERLLDAGIDVDFPNKYGRTPLSTTVAHGYFEMCKFLVQKGANPSFPSGALDKHMTPFQKAVQYGFEDTVAYFVRECGEDLAQRTSSGLTMLQLARKKEGMKTLLMALKTEVAVTRAVRLQTADDAMPTAKPSLSIGSL